MNHFIQHYIAREFKLYRIRIQLKIAVRHVLSFMFSRSEHFQQKELVNLLCSSYMHWKFENIIFGWNKIWCNSFMPKKVVGGAANPRVLFWPHENINFRHCWARCYKFWLNQAIMHKNSYQKLVVARKSRSINSNPWGCHNQVQWGKRGKTVSFSISKFTEMSRSSEEESGGIFWFLTWPFTCLVWKPKQIFLLFFSYFNCSRIWKKNKYFHFIFSILIAQEFWKKNEGNFTNLFTLQFVFCTNLKAQDLLDKKVRQQGDKNCLRNCPLGA